MVRHCFNSDAAADKENDDDVDDNDEA